MEEDEIDVVGNFDDSMDDANINTSTTTDVKPDLGGLRITQPFLTSPTPTHLKFEPIHRSFGFSIDELMKK